MDTATDTTPRLDPTRADIAWSRWVGTTNPDGTIAVYWSTNDDLDQGYPTEYAELRYTEPDRSRFLAHAGGGAGWGFACYRYVVLDGLPL